MNEPFLTPISNSYSESLANTIGSQDFSERSVTVVGYGNMGRQYVQALRLLRVGEIKVVSRSPEPLQELKSIDNVTTTSGGYTQTITKPLNDEFAIICTPTDQLELAARHLSKCGIGTILIEKPISLHSEDIRSLSDHLISGEIKGFCGYNRVSYPTVLEAKSLCESEGGITSCTYAFTEFIDRVQSGNFSKQELARWGIANSLHMMSLVHSVIGFPEHWNSQRSGSLPWHPSGSVFVGSGISHLGIPFSYHADWGSTGRWSAEFHTKKSSYRLCPLEHLTRRHNSTGDWEPISVSQFDPSVKYGVLEQVASMLSSEVRSLVPLFSLEQAADLTHYAEDIFGYRS